MPTFTSNGVPVPSGADHLGPLVDSSPLVGDGAAMRARYDADGYLLLRGVLDPGQLRELRATYFAHFEPAYLKPGTAPADGIFSGVRPSDLAAHGTTGHPAHAMVRSPEWDRFVSQPALSGLAEVILGGPVERLPRTILRQFDRSTALVPRAHTDYTYLDHGTADLVTIWIPIGDCPAATGSLVYLEGSHTLDPNAFDNLRRVTDRPGDDRPISHDLGWVSEQLGRRWLWTDFQAGDVAVHSPHMVHASLDTTTDRMRLSADVRFIRRDADVDPRWLAPWSGDDGN